MRVAHPTAKMIRAMNARLTVVSKPRPRVAADGPGPRRAFFARRGGAAPRQPGGAFHVHVLLAPRTGGAGRGQDPQMRFCKNQIRKITYNTAMPNARAINAM